jgi:MoaA/NifB/PqqE/SkfB family radical SAM enzyme
MCSFWKDRSIKVANYQKGLKTIDSLYAKGVRFLVLTGGEPLLVKHLEDLIRYAKKKGMLCGITTNGTLLTKERFNSLIDAGVNNITVSLDSLKEEIHDDIRGVRGTYKKTLNNFNEIKELPRGICQYLMLMCVISLKNKDEIEKLIKFAGRNKVKIIFQPYNPYRRYDKTFLMSVKDMKETIEKVIKLKNMGYPVFNSRPFLRGFVKYYRGERQKCLAGKLYIHADCNGKLTPCTDCVNSACIKQCLNGRSKTLPGCWMNCTGETESTLTPIGLIDKLYDLILLPIAFIGKREN